ncbi:MAG: hypothetical protein U5L96_08980 [Owenweeksia sp.]|nr:hypothetical protein [Owenweeksia sp.]
MSGPVKEAFAPMSVSLTLEDDIDISRGDMIVRPNNQPRATQDLDVMLCWLKKEGPLPRAKYVIKQTTNDARTMIKDILYKVDINTLHRVEDDKELTANEIARVQAAHYQTFAGG